MCRIMIIQIMTPSKVGNRSHLSKSKPLFCRFRGYDNIMIWSLRAGTCPETIKRIILVVTIIELQSVARLELHMIELLDWAMPYLSR
jgi:hypothetical protein